MKSKSFLKVKGWTFIPVEEDEKMLYEVNPTSFWLFTLIDVFCYLGPTNLLFPPRISASGTHSRFLWPSLICSVLTVWKMFVGWWYETGTGSIHLSAELVVALLLEIRPCFSHGCRGKVNLTGVNIWKPALFPLPSSSLLCSPTPTPVQWCV